MPKARKTRTHTHDQSARLDKRQFTLPGRAEHVEIGAQEEVAVAKATDLLESIENPEKPNLKKKEKQQLKHDAFMKRLESSHTPYSKSHARRLKRKEKEKIASGLQDIAFALPQVEDNAEENAYEERDSNDMDMISARKQTPSRKKKAGLIGAGKGVPLSEKQRRQVLKTEKIRQPLLLATPEFASNPFKTLRIHAQNTLVKHAPEKR